MNLLDKDLVRGALYGHAIGDALGLGAEFMSREEVRRQYPNGLRCYGDILPSALRNAWQRGEWTDDTAQMLCILDSLLKKNEVDISDIAAGFYDWACMDGRGMGRLTSDILFSASFLEKPQEAARISWEKSGGKAAPNGALMRTSVLGIWDYADTEKVVANTEQVCTITHADPRCIASCVAMTLTINHLVLGFNNLANVLTEITPAAAVYDKGVGDYLHMSFDQSLESLRLDEASSIGYTYKTLSAGFWALKHALSFEDGLYAILCEGGDADTNGAVAGALLGARFGFSSIPEHLVDGLVHKKELEQRIGNLLSMLG